MIKDEVFSYTKKALANKDLDTILNDRFRNAVFNYFSIKGYSDLDIDKIQQFMEELVLNLRERGLRRVSEEELDQFFNVPIENTDQSYRYKPGLSMGEPKFKAQVAQKSLYEDGDLRITSLGTLYYDNNQEYIEKYMVVRFAKENHPSSTFECYSEINGVMMANDEEYRKKVAEQLNKMNIKAINCSGYIGTVAKNKENLNYEVSFDDIALSAVIDYEKREREKDGEGDER